jgi:hypothetical protein
MKSLTNRAAVVKVSSVVNPLLWLAATVTPTALVASVLTAWLTSSDLLPVMFGVLAFLPPLMAGFAYAFWSIRDPDRLQSEEFQLKQTELLMVQKHSGTPISVDDVSDVGPNKALIQNRVEKK